MDRNIQIFVNDANGKPLNGAIIEFMSNVTLLGTARSANGRASIQVQNQNVEIIVRVKLDGELMEAKLAKEQNSYTFNYPIVTEKSFLVENLPAVVGLALIMLSVTLGFGFNEPSGFQKQLILIVMSLGAGGLASIIPGLINVELNLGQKFAVSAAGALAVFVIVFFNEPAIFDEPNREIKGTQKEPQHFSYENMLDFVS